MERPSDSPVEWSGFEVTDAITPRPGPSGSPDLPDIIDLFLQQVALRPDHAAITYDGHDISYAALERRVRGFAARIAQMARPRVLIALPQGPDAYAAMLATGLAGGYYTPLNLAAPMAKLRLVARALRPDIIVGSPDIARQLAEGAPDALVLDPAMVSDNILFAGRGRRHELAYVIFTSGTTGVPKGVVIERRSLDHYIDWLRTDLALRPDDRVSQFPNIAFDLSVIDIYGTFCSGATLCPLTGMGDRLLPARAIERERITVWVSVPSVVGIMMQANDVTSQALGSVRRYLFCGEPLLREHVAALFAACPEAVVQNTYGPTEATVSMTSIRLDADSFARHCTSSVALGAPIPGMSVVLQGGVHADEGELVIVGPQLARGYWEDPGRTARQFRTVLVDGVPVRGYATGDWVERRGGQLYFKERIDFQVKIRGYRIELDEVAAAVRACGWPTVCVLKHRDMLVAILERSPTMPFEAASLRARLSQRIEAHMVPSRFCLVDRLPRTDNDKIDRHAVARWLDGQAA